MFKLLSALDRLLRALVAVVILTVLGVAGWFGYQTFHGDKLTLRQTLAALAEHEADIKKLNEDLQAKEQEIHRLDTAIRLLKVDHRVARVDVLSQTGSAEKGDLATKFTFVELGPQGLPLESPKVFTIQGDVVYVDAWVVKFNDQLVETGDPERSASLYLFRRIFGEAQQPKDGFAIDKAGSTPAPYRSGKPVADWEQEIWAHFWEYANDQAKAERLGVRAAHGEAPSIKLLPGKRYRVQLRASDGLTIVPEDAAAGKTGSAL